MNIILTTMIKNEARTITRLLNSCLGVATHYCVVDTGSTDDTVEVVKTWCKDHDVPGVVFNIEFKDFGSTRTATVKAAQGYAAKQGFDLADTYLLLLDADMILKNGGFKPEDLKDDVIRITQGHGSLAYQNVRLVRANLDVSYVGRTHEYVSVKGKHIQVDYKGLAIDDIGDGGCKADKFERDYRLLQQDLQDNPKNERSLYYLGATCEALGKNQEAIEFFTRRSEAGGFEEEAWMAIYRRGLVHMSMKNLPAAERDFLLSWGRRPWRAEPLQHLAQLYLDTNRQTHACAVAKAALNIPYPKNDVLFIEPPCYHDEFHRILSIGDFYTGKQYDGAWHSDALILRKGARHRDNALQNASWYMEKLPVKRTLDLGSLVELKEGWHACNPSIIRDEGSYNLSVRTVNYTINPNGSYNYPSFVGTETYWVKLNDSLGKISSVKLQNPAGRADALIRGIEDVRFYKRDGNLVYALGVRADGEEGFPQLYDCQWDQSGELEHCCRVSAPGRVEKNWLPFELNGDDKVIYCTGPQLRIMSLGIEPDIIGEPALNVHDLRGGAGPIPFMNGMLWITHQVTIRGGMTRRTYMHRFVWVPSFDQAHDMRVSRPFYFQDQTIEFCSGMCRHGNSEILLTYGFMDNTANLAVVDASTISGMLHL